MNLAEFLTHILALENDPTKGVFTDAQNTVGLRDALYRYSVLRPYHSSSLFDGADTTVHTLTGLTALAIRKVWHVQTDPQNNIVLDFHAWLKAGEWHIDTKNYAVPTGTNNILVDTSIAHTIEDLDSGTATTIPLEDQTPVAEYAAGYAILGKANSNIENNNLNPYETKNYIEMGTLFQNNFNSQILKDNDQIRTANWHDKRTVDGNF